MTVKAVGRFFTLLWRTIIRATRAPSALVTTVKRVILTTYDGIRRVRLSARALHPEGKLRVLLVHPTTLYSLILCVFLALLYYNIRTRPLASEDLERKSIFYHLISAEAYAITIETAPPSPLPSPPSVLNALERPSDDMLDTMDNGAREFALFTAQGALIRPNPSDTRRGSRPRDTIVRYIVQTHDTISDIAYRYNLSARSILWANNLGANSYIRPGDTLIIPQTDGVVYTIQKGDTLGAIATRYRSTVEKISAVNSLNSTVALTPGTVITVPDGVPPSVARPTPPRVVAQPASPVSSPRVSSGNGLTWPTTGHVITQYFGWRHTGIDVDGNLNSPIFAAADGTVEVSQGGWNGGYGNVIVIDHGRGTKTRYGHLSRLMVKSGDTVKAGQVIGIMGSTGRSTGSHLHFEVIIGGARKNPLSYL